MWSFLDMIIVVKLAKNKSVSIVMIHISMILHTHTQSNCSEGCFILFYIFLASNIIAQQVEKF